MIGISLFKPFEEAVGVPSRPLVSVRYIECQIAYDIFELTRSSEIDRLIQIVGRGMITLGEPLLLEVCFRRAFFEADLLADTLRLGLKALSAGRALRAVDFFAELFFFFGLAIA